MYVLNKSSVDWWWNRNSISPYFATWPGSLLQSTEWFALSVLMKNQWPPPSFTAWQTRFDSSASSDHSGLLSIVLVGVLNFPLDISVNHIYTLITSSQRRRSAIPIIFTILSRTATAWNGVEAGLWGFGLTAIKNHLFQLVETATCWTYRNPGIYSNLIENRGMVITVITDFFSFQFPLHKTIMDQRGVYQARFHP